MQIDVAVVGAPAVGKTELIKQMAEYVENFTFEEYLINTSNVKDHDFYLYVMDISRDWESQLKCVNPHLKNFMIVATKGNADFEKEKLIALEKEILGREVMTFYFSLSDVFHELSIVKILIFIMKTYCKAMEEFSNKLYEELTEEQSSKLNNFIILFLAQDKVVQDKFTKLIIKQNCIPKFIPSFQKERIVE